jgi:hypothetical protein
MFSLIIFIISFFLILTIFLIKGLEIYYAKVFFLTRFLKKADNFILQIISNLKTYISHLNFKNIQLIFSWIMVSISKLIRNIKRRFDHKQSHFFSKRDHLHTQNKGAVSFFLKDVSDYKKSLREEMESK